MAHPNPNDSATTVSESTLAVTNAPMAQTTSSDDMSMVAGGELQKLIHESMFKLIKGQARLCSRSLAVLKLRLLHCVPGPVGRDVSARPWKPLPTVPERRRRPLAALGIVHIFNATLWFKIGTMTFPRFTDPAFNPM
ncbi:hypothetical protein DFH09DRAFT_1072920 [Mycena vulgaris]|nr:hypothetical protein DFH09DRAFT_1072920 [Mycena vulgaris]